MFRLAHFSDIHLSPMPQPTWRQLIGKRFTGYMNWCLSRKAEMAKAALPHLIADWQRRIVHHTAISGDLVNLALPQEFANARNWLQPLGAVDDISLVPGNHDAYVRGSLKQFCRVFAPWMHSDMPENGDIFFPWLRRRGPIALIGVSSAIATPPFCAAGFFDKPQADRLGKILQRTGEEGLFRIVIIHHPPLFHATHWHKRLWGIRRFQAGIAAHGAELVLHGHTHLPTLSSLPGKNGGVPVVGIASAAQSFGGHKPPAAYNLFEIGQKTDKTWHCVLIRRGIVDDNNTIAEQERQVLQQ